MVRKEGRLQIIFLSRHSNELRDKFKSVFRSGIAKHFFGKASMNMLG